MVRNRSASEGARALGAPAFAGWKTRGATMVIWVVLLSVFKRRGVAAAKEPPPRFISSAHSNTWTAPLSLCISYLFRPVLALHGLREPGVHPPQLRFSPRRLLILRGRLDAVIVFRHRSP